jgi:hypothetical protein
MVNIVPLFSSVSCVIVPPKEFMLFFTIAKPRPMPPVLVVNLGSNILVIFSSDIPEPLS